MNFSNVTLVPPKSENRKVVLTDVEYEKEVARLEKERGTSNKRTLAQLMKAYFQKKIWLYRSYRTIKDVYRNLRIVHYSVKGEEYLILRILSHVYSSKGGHAYQVNLAIRRHDHQTDYDTNMKCEVHCTCPAFHYWLAYPDLRTRNFYGSPKKWNRVRNKVRNPALIPSTCKHVVRTIMYSIDKKVIKHS